MTLSLILVLAVVFLALSNGANDNFKGVASLFGSRTVGYRVALAWATVAAAAGSMAALALAEALLRRFSGKGLVPDALASVLGLPVSTTHVSVGALAGIGLSNGRAEP